MHGCAAFNLNTYCCIFSLIEIMEIQEVSSFEQLSNYLKSISTTQRQDNLVADSCGLKFIELLKELMSRKDQVRQQGDGLTQNQDDLNQMLYESKCAADLMESLFTLPLTPKIRETLTNIKDSVEELVELHTTMAHSNNRMQEIIAEANNRKPQKTGCMGMLLLLLIPVITLLFI